jgi:hypothetical protein
VGEEETVAMKAVVSKYKGKQPTKRNNSDRGDNTTILTDEHPR